MNEHHEIVIIRRGGQSDSDDHHGGVWKIAFADFMTAMMAFFLVMWLISANDKTRASVARYFNPVKLVDATTQPRGLHDPKNDDSGVTASADTKERSSQPSKPTDLAPASGKGPTAETAAGRQQRLDKTLLENPYAALAEIVGTKGPSDTATNDSEPRPAAVMGLHGGDQFRDPFAPPPPQPAGSNNDDAPTKPALPRGATQSGRDSAQAAKAAAEESETKGLLASLRTDGAAGPAIDVRRNSEGLLVSLTDTASFAMFANGSAVPSRRVVLMMAHVAQVLKTHPGIIVVRGYTDNKPFHTTRYDNWRLSLDRAQVAHYMLVRGGLTDTRIGHIEGYADRASRPGTDPGSALNRRIEILLKDRPS